MHRSPQKMEEIVERFFAANPTMKEIARALGTEISEQEGEILVRIASAPFETARVSQYHDVIKVSFNLFIGSWRMNDITNHPEAWSTGPVLPDSGSEDVDRDWDRKNMTIRCITRVEGEGPLGELVIKDLRCQITPR